GSVIRYEDNFLSRYADESIMPVLRRFRRRELLGDVFMVGCYPHGDFSEETKRLAEDSLSLSDKRLEAWTAVSRLLCIAEEALNIM
ncbi:MAG: hypothetical protein QW789_04125, partial [Nitrososphaerota archaeon]